MRLESVSLTDFGVFRNGTVELGDGLTVVAGPQRAGKTTFREAVRKLPYGISRGDDVPPAVDTHELSASVVHEGHRYDLSLEGQAEPVVRCVDDGPSIRRTDLTGNVSKRQYEQLFAVGQEQLRRLPDGIDDASQLSDVILGAAYGDIAAVPEIREEFRAAASDIAGKHGRKSYRLNDPLDTVEEGLAERRSANEMVEDYESTRGDLEAVEAELQSIAADVDELRSERQRLTVLESKFDDLAELRSVRRELESLEEPTHEFPADAAESAREHREDLEEAAEAVASCRDELLGFFDDPEAVDVRERSDALLASERAIDRYERRLEVWRETEADLEERAAALEERRADLERRAGDLHADWTGDLESVLEVPTDSVAADRLREAVSDHEDAEEALESETARLERDRARLAELRDSLDEAESELEGSLRDGAGTGRGAVAVGGGVAGVGLLVGAAVGSVLTPLVGFAVAGVALLVGLGYLYGNLGGRPEVDAAPVRELRAQVNELEADVSTLEDVVEDAERELDAAREELEACLAALELPTDLSPAGTVEFYRDTRSLQSDIRALEDAGASRESDLEEFEAELQSVRTTLATVLDAEWGDGSPLEETDRIYASTETAVEALEAASGHERALEERRRAKASAVELLEGWSAAPATDDPVADVVDALEAYADAAAAAEAHESLEADRRRLREAVTTRFDAPAVVEAFQPVADGDLEALDRTEGGLSVLEALADEYATRDAVEERLREIETRLEELEETRESLREDAAELEATLDDLASDEDVRRAEAKIQRGRDRFERRYEEYATCRLGERLLDRVHDRFVEEATGPLLEDASELFAAITREYAGIDHVGELDALEFEAIREGDADQSTDELSRATAEQLFLAVRLAKVRRFGSPLPVVVDDALTNFDPAHAGRTIGFLDELTETNQVVYLTCHPEVVQHVDGHADVDAFWTLTDGYFDGPFGDPADCVTVLEH